jgi:hypothetical protein
MRRISETKLVSKLLLANPKLTRCEARLELATMYAQEMRIVGNAEIMMKSFEASDIAVMRWINDKTPDFDVKIEAMSLHSTAFSLTPAAILESFLKIAPTLDEKSRQRALKMLSSDSL